MTAGETGCPAAGYPNVAPRRAKAGGDFDWAALAALTVHPLKVAIIEALRWMEQPLSTGELVVMLADAAYNSDMVLYHAGGLIKLGFLEVTHHRQVRGAREKYYFFPPAERGR